MNNSHQKTPNILAYFSHSYRAGDRDVNLFFWELFSSEGFFFTIDPKSDSFIIPHLERLMRFSDCFIAVVTKRDGEAILPTYSPYIAFENFLAELADKPRLLFVENVLKLDVFGDSDCVFPFDRNLLRRDKSRFQKTIRKFAKTVKTYMSYNEQRSRSLLTSKAGIITREFIGSSGDNEEYAIIERILEEQYTCQMISPKIKDGLQKFIRQLSELELVVIDVSEPDVTGDALAIIQAKAIPCIRVARTDSKNVLENLKANGLLKNYFIGDDVPVILWQNPEELKTNLGLYLSKFKQSRTPLETFDEGEKYFRSAGRKPAKVFISNPGSLNPLALELVKELQTLNIQYFQYQSNSRIEIGTKWEEVLEQQLREFNIFVALINDDFHNSKYCERELQIAVERYQNNEVTILPYLCGNTSPPSIIRNLQYEDVSTYAASEKVKTILAQIEKELYRKEDPKRKTPLPGKPRSPVDRIIVLFLASNPAQTTYLNLDIEVEKIDNRILSSRLRDKVDLKKHFAQKPEDLQGNLLRYEPAIVHFSGHGERTGELLFMDKNGQPAPVSIEALKSLFTSFSENVRVIVLNACYSRNQAEAISEVIDFVIGMNLPISDGAAIAFSEAFYQAIGYGKTVQEAFNLGKNAISLAGIPEEDTPQLFVKSGVDASASRLIV